MANGEIAFILYTNFINKSTIFFLLKGIERVTGRGGKLMERSEFSVKSGSTHWQTGNQPVQMIGIVCCH